MRKGKLHVILSGPRQNLFIAFGRCSYVSLKLIDIEAKWCPLTPGLIGPAHKGLLEFPDHKLPEKLTVSVAELAVVEVEKKDGPLSMASRKVNELCGWQSLFRMGVDPRPRSSRFVTGKYAFLDIRGRSSLKKRAAVGLSVPSITSCRSLEPSGSSSS